MGDFAREYPTLEVAIQTVDYADDRGGECVKAGDIVVIRRPLGLIGTADRARRLWLLIDGLEEEQRARLVERPMPEMRERVIEIPDEEPIVEEYLARFDKRRYAIPLERLKEVYPLLDLEKLTDSSVEYQPFMALDIDTGEVVSWIAPLPADGLVYDKETRSYV
jgi:hypothetical protein